MNTTGVHTLSEDLISSFISPAECQLQKAAGTAGKGGGTRVLSQAGLLLNATFSTCAMGERASHQGRMPSPNALEEISS